MTERAGRRLVMFVIAAFLLTPIGVIVTFNLLRGSERLAQQLVHLALTVVLCVFLYRGAGWARWVAGLLAGLSGVGILVSGLFMKSALVWTLSYFALGAIYLTCGLGRVSITRVCWPDGAQRLRFTRDRASLSACLRSIRNL